MTDLHYPPTTVVGKHVPKNAFYEHLEMNANMKKHFEDDIHVIKWLYKLAPSTLNVEDGKTVHEIVVFSVKLKSQECPDDVFLFIDKNMPRHVVFILEFEERYKLLFNYKEWLDTTAETFKIVKSFASEWLDECDLLLPIKGLTMDAIYENMAGSVSGYGTTNSEDTKRAIELQSMIQKEKKNVEALQKRIRTERQFNRKVVLNNKVRISKAHVENWQKELKSIINTSEIDEKTK